MCCALYCISNEDFCIPKHFLYFLQTQQLCQYVLNLAKYDQSYDIRDRARFLRPIVFPGEKVSFYISNYFVCLDKKRENLIVEVGYQKVTEQRTKTCRSLCHVYNVAPFLHCA